MKPKLEHFADGLPPIIVDKKQSVVDNQYGHPSNLISRFLPTISSTFDSDVCSEIGPDSSQFYLKRIISLNWQYNDQWREKIKQEWKIKHWTMVKQDGMSNENLNFIPLEHFESLNIRISWEPDMNSALWGK